MDSFSNDERIRLRSTSESGPVGASRSPATRPVLELVPSEVVSSPDKDLHDLHRRGAAVVEPVPSAFLEEVGVPRSDLHGPFSVQV